MNILLKQSCCGCSLSTGTKIIAFLSLLGCLVTIIFDTYALHHILILYRGRHRDAADISHTITVQMNFNEQKRKADIKINFVLSLTLLVGSLVISTIDTVMSFLLILAVYQHRPKLALPWLVTSILSLIVFGIGFILLLVTGTFLHGFLVLIAIGLGGYFWLVVYSHWHAMPDRRAATDAPDYYGNSSF